MGGRPDPRVRGPAGPSIEMAKLRGKVLGRLGGFPKLSAPRFCLLHPFPRVRLPPRERETPESPGRKAKVITNQVAQLALVPRAAGHRVVEVARIEAIVGRDPIARAGHHGVIFRRLNIGRELAFPDASGEMLRADPAARGRNIARHRVGEIARFESILGGNPVLGAGGDGVVLRRLEVRGGFALPKAPGEVLRASNGSDGLRGKGKG